MPHASLQGCIHGVSRTRQAPLWRRTKLPKTKPDKPGKQAANQAPPQGRAHTRSFSFIMAHKNRAPAPDRGPSMTTELKNDRFLRALLRQPTDRTPIWMMRQAGRYLPEYRESRARAGSFMDLCTNPDMACEVTLQPLARYPLDAAILFSDILTIPDAMGLGLYLETGEGPRFRKTVRTEADINALPVPDV